MRVSKVKRVKKKGKNGKSLVFRLFLLLPRKVRINPNGCEQMARLKMVNPLILCYNAHTFQNRKLFDME